MEALCLEALSALSGCSVMLTPGPSQLGPQDFVNIVSLRQFYKQEGFQELEYPSLGSLSLREEVVVDPEADLYSSPPALEAPQPGHSSSSARAVVRVNTQEFFDRKYDYDFTHVRDGEKQFFRGNERYVRPCGWRRVALNVAQKYDDGDDLWLGTGATSWPVSYQGLHMDGSLGVILTRKESREDDGFLKEAAQSLVDPKTLGRGIYSTPDVHIAEKHCKTFKSQTDGKTYKVLLQNRINPKRRRDCQRDRVWVVYVPEDHNDVQTRALVQESVRPYGLLLKLV